MQQGRWGDHYTGHSLHTCSSLGQTMILGLNARVLLYWITEVTSMKCVWKEKAGLCQLSLHTWVHRHAHTTTNHSSSLKSSSCWQGKERLFTSKLECVLLTPWAAAAKCPAHVLFYESLASVRLFLLLFELKWIHNLAGQGHRPGWQCTCFLVVVLSLPSTITLHAAQKIKHSSKIRLPPLLIGGHRGLG